MSPSFSGVVESNHEELENLPQWKQELNQRLAATRNRRRNKDEQIALPGIEPVKRKTETRAAQLAAKVAQRYANAPSYSDVLAAAANAEEEEEVRAEAETPEAAPPIPIVLPVQAVAVEHHEEPMPKPEPMAVPVEPLVGNLIEHPRELVAPRKARPRLAEGPLRADSWEAERRKNFEETVNVGKRPADWTPIRLDPEPVKAVHEPLAAGITLHTAPLEDRIMAGVFDLALIVAAFAVFVLVFVACTTHPPMGKPAMIGAGLVLAGFGLLYHYLFFKYSQGTPGMRYAKIALCTFEDENPSREEMCRRVVYLMLSAAPLGLGFAWACFDPDRLSWHDRMSRIYQRSYS